MSSESPMSWRTTHAHHASFCAGPCTQGTCVSTLNFPHPLPSLLASLVLSPGGGISLIPKQGCASVSRLQSLRTNRHRFTNMGLLKSDGSKSVATMFRGAERTWLFVSILCFNRNNHDTPSFRTRPIVYIHKHIVANVGKEHMKHVPKRFSSNHRWMKFNGPDLILASETSREVFLRNVLEKSHPLLCLREWNNKVYFVHDALR